METLITGINILFFLALLGTILGLIRPVIVLWFMHRFNRLSVIKYYGVPTAILYFFKLTLAYWA
ncbi:hypothetical protein Q4534_22560 [Cyclobacterium sp. 1_MG-2023]|uniref:hypothetical protein n=1 Tax=Cyclobacterium sp. 1_MG-2023 TaxID=3062681 RepID=UPI0026E41023|nr:hypothetical protein [Cyclobacterium sp. 1_MG-2023]MDO6440228.1 hypothetical protein [Cyclobacterium sp. 1_MG-2023]